PGGRGAGPALGQARWRGVADRIGKAQVGARAIGEYRFARAADAAMYAVRRTGWSGRDECREQEQARMEGSARHGIKLSRLLESRSAPLTSSAGMHRIRLVHAGGWRVSGAGRVPRASPAL